MATWCQFSMLLCFSICLLYTHATYIPSPHDEDCKYLAYNYTTGVYDVKYLYCAISSYCCGDNYTMNCCDNDLDDYITNILTTWMIAGIVIGSIIALALIVSFTICVVCMCQKQNRSQGTVYRQPQGPYINSTAVPGVTVMTQGTPAFPQMSYAVNMSTQNGAPAASPPPPEYKSSNTVKA